MGVLQFYTDGMSIMNHQFDTIGVGLNPGIVADVWGYFGYVNFQGLLILPNPIHPYQYTIFHAGLEIFDQPLNIQAGIMYHTDVDMEANGGAGIVTLKNNILYTDTLGGGHMTAVKHGNGRDWWVVQPLLRSNTYSTFLFKGDTIEGPFFQSIGESFEYFGNTSQSKFFKDGSRYIDFEPASGFKIMDFDRCTGLFSNPMHYDFPHPPDTLSHAGVSVSLSGRYLYISALIYVFQYDLESDDFLGSEQLVAEYDGYTITQWNYPTPFLWSQLAPNGKIYVTCSFSVPILHVIESPDVGGIGCNVNQHSIETPSFIARGIPYFPNFRLGPLTGSECDTVTTSLVPHEPPSSILLYPNPARDIITLKGLHDRSVLTVYDRSGKEVLMEKAMTKSIATVEVGHLTDGVYFYEIVSDQTVLKVGKLVVE